MKELKIVKRSIQMVKDGPTMDTSSVEMIRFALEGNDTNRRGLLRIQKVIKILQKLDEVECNDSESILLESEEMDVIYESVDKYVWGPASLRFPEFFNEIEDAKKSSVNVRKDDKEKE